MSECRACGAEITWLRLESGMMPVNLDAEIIDDKGEKIVVCKPHWASCPKAGEFRQSNRPQKSHPRYPWR